MRRKGTHKQVGRQAITAGNQDVAFSLKWSLGSLHGPRQFHQVPATSHRHRYQVTLHQELSEWKEIT